MVQNLAKHHRVVAYDTNPNFINDLAKKDNIEVGTTVSAVAKQAQTIITMLPNDVVVSKVCDTLFAELQKGILCACSTRFHNH
jgi:3-hydroxyisobutyrate dehydrogenase-like beta-hydroxyacid dehydrogenase